SRALVKIEALGEDSSQRRSRRVRSLGTFANDDSGLPSTLLPTRRGSFRPRLRTTMNLGQPIIVAGQPAAHRKSSVTCYLLSCLMAVAAGRCALPIDLARGPLQERS